jgi:hypothetical protein
MATQTLIPSSEILYPHWQNEYEAALLELDGETLKDRIKAAEAAIERRLQQLAQDSNHHTERRVIHDALISLHLLKIFSRSDKPAVPQ